MKIIHSIVLLLVLTFLIGCKSNKEVSTISPKPGMVSFLDSVPASSSIVNDDIDGFYDQLSALEINIQMKNASEPISRELALKQYAAFIKTQVSNWNQEEKLAMLQIFKEVKKMCDTINPRIFPDGVRLIKVKTGHYGKDVYYTRGKNILIPENIFPLNDIDTQIPVMIHELFHVISRYNPQLKGDLYAMIGFTKTDKPVRLNAALSQILLTNPDGVSFLYSIDLDRNGETIKAIPLITSKFTTFRPDQPMFFDYLNFDLYNLEDKGAYYMANSTTTGKTLVPLHSTPSFFTKIKDNTQYIIHPDEIIADNFMLALQAYSKGEYGKFSKEGRMLIDKVLLRLEDL